MTGFKDNTFHFISVLLPFLCICIASSKASGGVINEICPKTRNPTLCFTILGRNQNASIRDLGQTAAESVQDAGILASDEIQVLIKEGKNPELLEKYRSCSDNYIRANNGVAQAKLVLKSSSYKGLPSIASAALAEADACDKNFVQVPSEPAQLKQYTKYFEDVCSILLVVSNVLAG